MRYTTREYEDLHGKRILLVSQPQKPPVTTVRTPISVLDLASYFRKYASATVDCAMMGHLPEGEYDYVGYSVLCENDDIEDEIRTLVEKYHPARVIVGGKWATNPGREVSVPDNVVFFSGPGELLVTEGIDYEVYPTWSHVDLATPGFDVRNLGIMTSRGCPYRCHFCHNTEKKVHHFEAARTVANIKAGFKSGGATSVFFNDDIFTSNADRMRRVLDLSLAVGVDIRGRNKFFTHVNFVKDSVLSMIEAFRPWRVEIGIESGSTAQLERMGKGFTEEKARKAVERLIDYGIPLSMLILIGFPGETPETLEETAAFVDRFRSRLDYIGVSYYQPVRNTVGWDMCVERLGREPEIGTRTHKITYVDPGLTEGVLAAYFRRIKGR